MKVADLQSATPADLQPYSYLRRSLWHLERGLFVAEGNLVVHRLLESSLLIRSLLSTPAWFRGMETLVGSRLPGNTPVWLAEKPELERVCGMGLNQGVLALAEVPEVPPLARLIQDDAPFLGVALDRIDHSVNVGSIVRSSAAFGATAVFTYGSYSHPYLRRAVRSSLGAVFRVPVHASDQLATTLAHLRDDHGIRLVAAETGATANLAVAPASGKVCLIFGNEHTGISREILRLNPEIVSIPVSASIGSLSVATAAGIFLYEYSRRHRRP